MIRCVFRGPVGSTLFVNGRPIASGEEFDHAGHAPPSGCVLVEAPAEDTPPAKKPARKRTAKKKTTAPKG